MNLFAFNCCIEQMHNMKELPPNTVCISINEEYADPCPLPFTEEKVLCLHFTDITYKIEDANGKDKNYYPINKEQTSQIVEFVKEHSESNFLVHCHAGISRSSAVCLFINIFFKHKLMNDFWKYAHPNPFVLGALTNCFLANEARTW